MPLAIGTRLASYEILALLGRGGMGEVYRARDTRLKREVAIKVLPDAFSQDPDRLARFQREAELLATLNHPNIATVYGLEEADGVRALVLELVDGPTLADVIAGHTARGGHARQSTPPSGRAGRGGSADLPGTEVGGDGSPDRPIPLEEALLIARQIADALEAAHEHGIVELFYRSAANKLMAVAVTSGGACFDVGAVKPLFDVRPGAPRWFYDITPDGRRFLVNTAIEQGGSAPITLVVNWPALMKR